MAAGPAASFLSWGCQSTAPCRAHGVVLVCPLHRHQPCASALTFIRPARSVRSSQSVDCLAASCAAVQGSARPPAPSVPVVPPDFDGLLRASPCGLVASRSRPWGSSRFQTPAADREWDMGISHATRGASARGLFPGTHDPSKPFPCTQPSYTCGATEVAPSPFVDARLTDRSAPLGVTRLLEVHRGSHPGRSRSGFPSRRCSPASAHRFCHRSTGGLLRAFLRAGHRRRAWRNHSTSGSCSTYRSVAPARRCRRACARCFLGLSALHPPFSGTSESSEEGTSEEA